MAELPVTSSAQASRGLCSPWDGVTRQREARGRRAQTCCTGVSTTCGHFGRTIKCENQTRTRLTCHCKWQSTSWSATSFFENTVPNLAENLHVAGVGHAGWSSPRLRPPIFDHYLDNQISYTCPSPHPSIIPLRPLFKATCLKAQRLMEPIELCQTLPKVAPCALRLCMMSINGNNNDDRTYKAPRV